MSERDEVNLYGSPPFFLEIIGDAPTNVFLNYWISSYATIMPSVLICFRAASIILKQLARRIFILFYSITIR